LISILSKSSVPAILAGLTLLTLLALLAVLDQGLDRGRLCLLHGLLYRAAHALDQRGVQRDGQVGVCLVGQALLLQLLLDLLDLLQRLLHPLRDLLARLLAGLLDRLLDHLRELLRTAELLAAGLLAELLQRLGTGHHRHESSISTPRESRHKRLCWLFQIIPTG
jgi:hypothetical protein